jgi:hypothetical protein
MRAAFQLPALGGLDLAAVVAGPDDIADLGLQAGIPAALADAADPDAADEDVPGRSGPGFDAAAVAFAREVCLKPVLGCILLCRYRPPPYPVTRM